MVKYYFDIIQLSEEWFAKKVAHFSGTSSADLLMDEKTKGYQNLVAKICEEKHTGERCESDTFGGNKATERGLAFEPIAINDFEMRYFDDVKSVGIAERDEWILCSPDGLINENGMIQIKCPIYKTQRKYQKLYDKHKDLTDNEILQKIENVYYKQMQFELMVTDREYNIFYSFHPKLKEIKLKILRDEVLIKQILDKIELAKITMNNELKELK